MPYSSALAKLAYSFLKKMSFATKAMAVQSLQSQPLYVFNLHKSGTHLLKNILNEIGLQTYKCKFLPNLEAAAALPTGGYLTTTHRIPCDDVRVACAQGIAKIILNIRDPRDIFLSNIDFFDWTKRPTAFPHVNFYREAYSNAFKNRTELAEALLDDFTLGDYPYTISNQLNSGLVLCHHPSVLTIRYEELHAHSSPSVAASNMHPVIKICNYLSLDIPSNISYIIADSINMGSRTMNIGLPSRWETELEPELLKAFEEKHKKAIVLLGYKLSTSATQLGC